MNQVHIYTDGSCLSNPGPGGWGVLILGETNIKIKGGEAESTNNRMEMTAIINALKWIKKEQDSIRLHQRGVKIHSDSNLVVSTLTKGWKRKKNLDLWELIDGLLEDLKSIKIEWTWVKAHTGDGGPNEIVDKLAWGEAKKFKRIISSKRSDRSRPVTTDMAGKNQLSCKTCDKNVNPELHLLETSGKIKAICPHCKKYLKFVKVNKENLKKAKKDGQESLF